VPRKPKPISEMTDKELVKKVFAAPVRKELKRVLADLNKERPQSKKSGQKHKAS